MSTGEHSKLDHLSPAVGRKRSRDEASTNIDQDASLCAPQDDWVRREGKFLVKPTIGYCATASIHSGTFFENHITIPEEAPYLRTNANSRNTKSQRVCVENHNVAANTATSNAHTCTGVSPNTSGEPIIDNFTIYLGIGWRKISDGDHLQAAARGWARFIENHFPLSHVQILLESKGMQSYLVESAQGYFLFTEDLRQARLVSRNADSALQNLRCAPPRFDSGITLFSVESSSWQTGRQVESSSTDSDIILG